MFLYSLTLNQTTGITHSICGSFTQADQDELVVAKGKVLEMYKVDSDTRKLKLIYRREVFGLIRSVLPFRLMGMTKDFIVVGSDSGRIVILEFDLD
jgi:splicing factor 3B subunit 3